MSEFTIYSYQCCPVKITAKKNEVEDEEYIRFREEQNAIADENMNEHQQIINDILTIDAEKFFTYEKKGKEGRIEKRLAFFSNDRHYPFIVLIPKKDGFCDGVLVFRVAKLGKKFREENWKRIFDPHEPSVLVIMDNRYDRQQILIEHCSEWGDTNSVRNVIRNALDKILRKYFHLSIRIEPVWQKSDFWVALRKHEGHIRAVEFDVGYPNMGRTGNKLLKGIKAECKLMYASPTMRFSVPKEVIKKKKKNEKSDDEIPALNLDPEYQSGLMGELWENCRENGRTAKLELDNKRVVHFGRKPHEIVRKMSKEEREEYMADRTQMYSTSTITVSNYISKFNGQDDLFSSTTTAIIDILNSLARNN